MAHDAPAPWILPETIATPADVLRLKREVSALDDYLHQQTLRTPGKPMERLPKLSRLLDELAAANNANLLEAEARQRLIHFLSELPTKAPMVHMSFSSDPAPAFLQKLVGWFRKNIHPHILIRVGLQPTLAGGCILRTTNKYFDLSLRKKLEKERNLLVQAIAGITAVPEEQPAPAAEVGA